MEIRDYSCTNKGGSVKDRLGVLIDPRFWVRNYRVSHYWDKKLSAAMDLHPVVPKINKFSDGIVHVVQIGPYKVWVENWPYAFGTDRSDIIKGLPTRRTALRLRKLVEEAITEFVIQEQKDNDHA